jgi:hypothetical protein
MLRSKSERIILGLNKSNEEKLKIVVCTPQEQQPQILTSFLKLVQEQERYIYTPAAKFSDVFEAVTKDVAAAMIICIATKEELPEMIQLLANLKSRIDAGTHKIIVYNQVNNNKATGLLRSKGVSEVVEQNVSLKALQYKFNNIVNLIDVAIKRSKTDVKNKSGEKNISGSNVNKSRKAGQVVFSAPIEHFSDFWLLMNQKNVRFVIGKWFVNFYGPGPGSGSWEPYSEKVNDEQGWIWNPRKADDKTFYQDEGRWVFFGNCPEFSWEEKHWYFISKKPEFAFYVDKKVLHKKIQILENGDVQFCENSKIGKSMQGAILQSIEASIHLKDSYRVGKNKDSLANEEEKNTTADFRQKKEIEESRPDFTDSIDKERAAADYRDEQPVEKEYAGCFSEQFEERKKKYTESYDCTELSLGLLAVNGKKNTTKIQIEVIELREKYLVLDVPADLLKVDDLIELEAVIRENGIEKRVTVGAATQIVETEQEDEETKANAKHELRSVAICELNEIIGPQFVELIKAFKDKRDQMSDFFSKAKGVA